MNKQLFAFIIAMAIIISMFPTISIVSTTALASRIFCRGQQYDSDGE